MTKHHINLWGSVLVLIIAMIVGLVLFGGKPIGPQTKISTTPPKAVSASDWIRGDITAQVVIVEYSDFQCQACGAYYPILKRLKEKFGAQVGFVYRHFPLSVVHSKANIAAMASEAAGQQGKFWEMHDLLFERQKAWSGDFNVKETFIGYARELQLEENKFSSDLDSATLQDKISASYDEGISIGINGTPTFYLNSERIPELISYEEFENKISEKLSQ
ncbi:MAG: DsbA family protein [bacterium]|nr:DsbA family protein [bacterium]